MNPKRALLYSIAAGILGMLLVFIYIQSKKAELEAQRRELIETGVVPGKVQVVIAAKDIRKNNRITADMITTRIIDEGYAPPGTVSNPYQIIGCFTLRDIEKGQQIFQDDISRSEGSASTLSVLIGDPNFRAVSIPADGIYGLSGLLKPGDRIDILATFNNLPGKTSKVTTTLCQNVRVIAVGKSVGAKDITSEYDSITVAVTPKEVQTLSLAINSDAVLNVSLRARGDEKFIDTEQLGELELGAILKIRKELTEQRQAIEIIRGRGRDE